LISLVVPSDPFLEETGIEVSFFNSSAFHRPISIVNKTIDERNVVIDAAALTFRSHRSCGSMELTDDRSIDGSRDPSIRSLGTDHAVDQQQHHHLFQTNDAIDSQNKTKEQLSME
tara:strand:- start:623 stop:967 length:345 start_codon:yes stop_codon:yes gene_type:complete